MDQHLSEHFTLRELISSPTASRKGIDNTPDAQCLRNLAVLAQELEKVRAGLGGRPIVISSGYRSPALNAAVGGSKSSAHMKGLAADFTVTGFSSLHQAAQAIANLPDVCIDQLILEPKWLHLGLAAPGNKPRRELLTANPKGGYLSGLRDLG